MVIHKLVLSKPGDFTALFFEKLKSRLEINTSKGINMDAIQMLDTTILDLINSASSSIDIMAPFQTNIDVGIMNKLIESIENGIELRIITRYCSEPNSGFDHGAIADYVKHFDHLENEDKTGSIHAKMLIKDKNEVYFGSGELMESSLNKNLEIGILTDESEIVVLLCNVFDTAWELAE